ncbi:MAG: leucine-rich repeat domain-containing protein, partial [Oligoflexus sp.]
CSIARLQFLARLPNLKTLNLYNNPFPSLEGVQVLAGLESIELGFTPATSLLPLNALPRLQSIELSGRPVALLQQLQRPDKLRKLVMRSAEMPNMQALAPFTQLEILDLASNQIQELRLETMPRLINLNVSANPLLSIEALRQAKALSELNISDTQVTNLDPLRNIRLNSFRADRIPLGRTTTKTVSNCPQSGLSHLIRVFCLTEAEAPSP